MRPHPSQKYRLTLPALAAEYGVNEKTLRRYSLAGVDIDDPLAVARHRALKNSNAPTSEPLHGDSESIQRKAPRATRTIPVKVTDLLSGLSEEEADGERRSLIEQLKKDEANKSKLLAHRVRKTKADADFREQQNLLLRGELTPIAAVRAEAAALGAFLTAEWTAFAREAATKFSERSVAEIEALAEPWLSEKLADLKVRLDHIGEGAAVAKAKEAKAARHEAEPEGDEP